MVPVNQPPWTAFFDAAAGAPPAALITAAEVFGNAIAALGLPEEDFQTYLAKHVLNLFLYSTW